MTIEQIKQLAEDSWEGCDGCDEADKNFFIAGFIKGFLSGEHNIIKSWANKV